MMRNTTIKLFCLKTVLNYISLSRYGLRKTGTYLFSLKLSNKILLLIGGRWRGGKC